MRFGSVCSGIEAASVAWGPLDWKAAWFSEIEPFPSATLNHHYPDVPNYGDMTTLPERILSGEVEAPGLLCGGTPCQAFSVAGNRKSLDDARGNLSLTFCEIANAIDLVRKQRNEAPAIIFWENVPGCRSTKDNFFGCFLGELCGATEALEIENGKWPTNGVIVGERRRVAWATLDARWFGLAQRRKRVFVVAYDNALVEHFGMPCPSEILSLGSCLPRNPTEGGKPRQGIAANAESGAVRTEISPTVLGFENSRRDGVRLYDGVTHTLQSFMGTGGGNTPCVTYGIQGNMIGRADTAGPQGNGFSEEVGYTLTKTDVHGVVSIQDVREVNKSQNGKGWRDDGIAYTVDTFATQGVATQYAVRRLTPVECERLQGFPDNYTNIPWRGKAHSPDGPRYKALGNSWAVPVVRWIGERINNAVNRL